MGGNPKEQCKGKTETDPSGSVEFFCAITSKDSDICWGQFTFSKNSYIKVGWNFEFDERLLFWQSQLIKCRKLNGRTGTANTSDAKNERDRLSTADLNAKLEKQMQTWKENPVWADQPPQIEVGTQLLILLD